MKWHSINEKRPNNHEYVLISHEDFETPMKAKYHSEYGGCFEFATINQGCYFAWCYDDKVKWWTKLPKKKIL